MHLAATHADTWVTTGDAGPETGLAGKEGAAAVRVQMDRLDEACERIGRDPSSIARLVLSGLRLDSGLRSTTAFDETVGRYEDAGVTDFVVHWPRDREPFSGAGGAFEEIFARRTGP